MPTVANKNWAENEGYSSDKRKRRRQHRQRANEIERDLDDWSRKWIRIGIENTIKWHRGQARYIGR